MLAYSAVVAESPRTGLVVPPQPTLRDGDVTLRPWRLDDVGAGRRQHDQEIAGWVGFGGAAPSPEQRRAAIKRWHGEYADGRKRVSFVVEHLGQVAGAVEVRQGENGTCRLCWSVFPWHRGLGVGTRAVRLLIRYAFDELGLHRIAAEVEVGNIAALRTAGRAGLRREGVLRGVAGTHGERRDCVLLARLSDDPEPDSRDGFLGVLNASLPTKRTIAQGLIHNQAGQILLCELTYKQEWDLPGGVVDPLESPAFALVREIAEELRIDVHPTRLVAVNWLPPYRAWADAMLFVFALELTGVDAAQLERRATLERREIRNLHWCTVDEAEAHVAPYVMRFLRSINAVEQDRRRDGREPRTLYLEDGDPTDLEGGNPPE